MLQISSQVRAGRYALSSQVCKPTINPMTVPSVFPIFSDLENPQSTSSWLLPTPSAMNGDSHINIAPEPEEASVKAPHSTVICHRHGRTRRQRACLPSARSPANAVGRGDSTDNASCGRRQNNKASVNGVQGMQATSNQGISTFLLQVLPDLDVSGASFETYPC